MSQGSEHSGSASLPESSEPSEVDASEASAEAELLEGIERLVSLQVTKHVQRIESFSGPLPPPDVLRSYNEILPGAAERIIAMAEQQAEHRRDLEGTVVHGSARRSRQGLWFGFVLSVVMIVAATWMVLEDHDWAGVSIIGVNLVGLVGAFVYGRTSQAKERTEKAAASS